MVSIDSFDAIGLRSRLNSRRLLFGILIFALSCSKPLKDPELLDPIYLDLKTQAKSYETEIKEIEASISDIKDQLKRSDPQSSNPKRLLKKLYEAEDRKVRLQQMVKYVQIRIQTRKYDAKKNYLTSYKKNRPWPDPQIHAAYQTHKRLLASPKKWDSRVPKLRQNGSTLITSRNEAPQETSKPSH